jgi:hypothetical protein
MLKKAKARPAAGKHESTPIETNWLIRVHRRPKPAFSDFSASC